MNETTTPETDYQAGLDRLRALGDHIDHAAARAHAIAAGARDRLPKLDRELSDAILGFHLGTVDRESVARLRRERQAVKDAIEDATLVDDAAERSKFIRNNRGMLLRRAQEAGQPYELNLPGYLETQQ